ncbi:MAG: DUF2730 family protein [Cycloclasticus sp.]
MDVEKIGLAIKVLEFALVVSGCIYAWWNSKTRATKQGFDEVNGRVNGHENRLNLIKQRLDSSPSHKEIGEVHQRVDQIGQAVTGIQGEMKQMNNTLQLIQQSLLEAKR